MYVDWYYLPQRLYHYCNFECISIASLNISWLVFHYRIFLHQRWIHPYGISNRTSITSVSVVCKFLHPLVNLICIGVCIRISIASVLHLENVSVLHQTICQYYISKCTCIASENVSVLHQPMCQYYIRRCVSITSDNVSVLHQKMCQYYIRKCISFTLVLQRLRPPHTDQNNLCYNKHELAFGDNQTIVTMQLLRYVDNYVRR